MALDLCRAAINKAAGRSPDDPLDDETLEFLAREIKRRQRERLADSSIDRAEAMRLAGEEFADDMKRAALQAQKEAAINAMVRLTVGDFTRAQFNTRREKGLIATLGGVQSARFGSADSAAAAKETMMHRYSGGFLADMEEAGVWDLFVSGAMHRETARALFAVTKAPDTLASMPKDAVQIAKIIHKWQETSRLEANAAGADIRPLAGFIVSNSHDPYKIMGKGQEANYQRWRAAFTKHYDLGPLADLEGDALEKALRKQWQEFASGAHMKAVTSEDTGFRGPRNIAKKLSKHRVFHPKSADDWFEYNELFGSSHLAEEVYLGLEHMARTTALLKKLGTTPEANLNRIIDDLASDITDAKQAKRFKEKTGPGGAVRNLLAEVDGSTRMAGNQLLARVSSTWGAIQNMSKLGGAVIPSITDLPTAASELKFQGRGGIFHNMTRILEEVGRGKTGAEKARLHAGLGVWMDSFNSEVAGRFGISQDGVPGVVSAAQRTFFKWNGLTWLTDAGRSATVRTMAHLNALDKGKVWDKLEPEFRRVLGLYRIDAARWDVLRQAVGKGVDGRLYMTADAVMDLPDEAVRSLLGSKFNPRRAEAMKREIAEQYRTYLVDRGNTGVLEPGARERAWMTMGSRPGTVQGELLRRFWQFKSFSVTFGNRVIGRELFARGADTWREIGLQEMKGFVNILVWTTIFGYGAMAAKDLVKGKTPRDPRDPNTIAAAMVQGGGMGIYGDFLFGEMRKSYGRTPLSAFLGPTFGVAVDIQDLIGRIIDASRGDENADVASNLFRIAMNNTPFINLFYTRMALDYLILYRITEELNPGALRRMEQRIQKENGQTFLVRPSQWVQ